MTPIPTPTPPRRPARPPVSVVMPFAGDAPAAEAAAAVLRGLGAGAQDELILADNAGVAPDLDGVAVVHAGGERSPAHARNVGAEHARRDWILFLDADCVPRPGLLDAYFARPVKPDVGALAGEVIATDAGTTLAERYGAARSFLSQSAHLAHPYLPRAVAANLMVRRVAFVQVGGFYEGIRAAEDTDFSWRLQQAGWRLELRADAHVEHRYRATLGELRAQWRGYAAGRAWLRRRYAGFVPEPAARRAAKRVRGRVWARRPRAPGRDVGGAASARGGPGRDIAPDRLPAPRLVPRAGPLERGRYLVLDALLAVDELAGFALSNRPTRPPGNAAQTQVVLVADRFPVAGDPLVDFARTVGGARVEAGARPVVVSTALARELQIAYREDDGFGARAVALAWLAVRHPVRSLLDAARRRAGQPTLSALAPAVRRLERQPDARVHALGSGEAQRTAGRLAALAGRRLDPQ